MAARERQRDEEPQQLQIQLSRSYNISNDAVRGIDAGCDRDSAKRKHDRKRRRMRGISKRGRGRECRYSSRVRFKIKAEYI